MQGITSKDALLNALFENYECIYDIDAETGAYRTYYESEDYKGLDTQGKGSDFFVDTKRLAPGMIHPEDLEYVCGMLSKEALKAALRKNSHYTFIYRIRGKENSTYYRLRAVSSSIEDKEHILIGISNIDAMMTKEREHQEELESMRQKERNYLAAILGSAEGYVEANLTTDTVTEYSEYFAFILKNREASGKPGDLPCYTDFNERICRSLVASKKERFREVCGGDYLLKRFENGDKRVSIQFYVQTKQGEPRPCRYVCFLYQDSVTADIHTFCVLYDLTEQQRKDLELRKLEEELRMSRISNFTSQMQPHFLYNALGSIQEVMLEDPEYASDLLGDFAVHLRSCVSAMSGDKPIPFSQEMENIRAYVNIEKMRFGEKLKVEYDIQTADFSILPLTVQPIVENAIRHGIYGRGPKGGTVTVRTRETGDSRMIEVEDDGVGFDTAAQRGGAGEEDHTGLRNLRFRLGAVMNGKVSIHSEPDKGTRITILLPRERSLDEDNNSR